MPARVPFLNWQIFNFATMSLINVSLPLRDRSTLTHFTCKSGFLIQVTRFSTTENSRRWFSSVMQPPGKPARLLAAFTSPPFLLACCRYLIAIYLLNTVIYIIAWHPLHNFVSVQNSCYCSYFINAELRFEGIKRQTQVLSPDIQTLQHMLLQLLKIRTPWFLSHIAHLGNLGFQFP